MSSPENFDNGNKGMSNVILWGEVLIPSRIDPEALVNAKEALLEIDHMMGATTPEKVAQVLEMTQEEFVKVAKPLLDDMVDDKFLAKAQAAPNRSSPVTKIVQQMFILRRSLTTPERNERIAREKPSE